MLLAISSLNGSLPSMKKNIENIKRKIQSKERDNKDIEEVLEEESYVLNNIYSAVYDGYLACEEIVSLIDYQANERMFKSIKRSVNRLFSAKGIMNIIDELEAIYDDYSDLVDENKFENHCYRDRYYKEYIFTEDEIDAIVNSMNLNRDTNVLQIGCGCAESLEKLKNKDERLKTYGLMTKQHSNKNYVRLAKARSHKIALGTIFGGKITNDAFDIFLATPDFSSEFEENYKYCTVKKIERSYIEDTYKFAREGSLIINVFPHFRLTKDMCLALSRRLQDVEIYKANCDQKMVMVIGRKKASNSPNTETYDLLRSSYNYDSLEAFSGLKKVYTPTGYTKEIDYFRGSVMDEEELEDFVYNDSSILKLIEKQDLGGNLQTNQRPLLPFKVGQIGLVLTSGCLDGLIDEGDGHYHLVKGMVNKKSDKNREIEEGKITETVISSNRVEINLLLPNGEFKKLS